MIRNAIHAAIKEELISLGAPDVLFVVERPADMSHGDYSTNAALVAAKILKRNPREVADDIKKKLENKIDGIEKIEVAGAGFINFFISHQELLQEVTAAQTESWGKNDTCANKVVMVEYTDPNPFKEFHIGHLMSNAIGESIARLLEWSGAEVLRANYQGDVGPHVAKAIWGARFHPEGELNTPLPIKDYPAAFFWGRAYARGAAAYENDEEAKKEIDTINQKVYSRADSEINHIYDIGRKVSLDMFEILYRKLGTFNNTNENKAFNYYFFESETGPKGLEIVQSHPEIFEKSEGATVFHGEKYGLHTRVFITKLGLPTYEAKELGLFELKREKTEVDESITVTASEQDEYFKVVLEAAKHVPELKDFAEKTKHVSHGMMRFAEGKMSSRKGNVITGESLLADLTDEAKTKMKERELTNTDAVAQQVAVGAIKYTVLKQGSGKDIIFDPDKSLSLEGDSGPYLQYAHTRALSLLRAANKAGIEASAVDAPEDAEALERILVHFPEVAERAAQELEPHYVTTYLTELAAAFNSWYASERVIGGKHEQYGVLLAQAVEQTLKKGLQVLGIPAPEEM